MIYTLTTEIESNLGYCQEHLKQLRNMQLVNQAVLDESRLDRDFLIAQHNQHPFGHSYLDDGNYRYWTAEEDYEKLHLWMVTWWNTFAQNEIFFNSLVASGLLLHIEDPQLRESIEAVYTTKKSGLQSLKNSCGRTLKKYFCGRRTSVTTARFRGHVLTFLTMTLICHCGIYWRTGRTGLASGS